MFENICSLPLSSDLFAQAIHPSEPLIAVGLASGHVQTYRLPPLAASSNGGAPASKASGYGAIETSWRTKRHKGSCRSLSFGHDGESLYSTGTDGIVKIAAMETGQVSSKIRVPLQKSRIDAPSLIHVLSPQSLLLATDSSALHIYDLRVPPSRPQQTHYSHDDYVSSLTPLPPTGESTSGFSKQWVSTGGTTLAVTDLRRGVLVKSEDQEEELLSSIFVSGLRTRSGHSKGERILVGDGNGVLTLWEKGVWDDQDERIIVDRGGGLSGKESLDSLTRIPDRIGQGIQVAVGLGNGSIKVVRLGVNKVVAQLSHDDVESVLTLGFEAGGRMISGGGQIVKVWQESVEEARDDDDDDELGLKRRDLEDSDGGESEDEGQESSEAEEQRKKKRKKRKRSKGKDQNGGKDVIAFKGID